MPIFYVEILCHKMAGMTAGLLAQKVSLEGAYRGAVFLHGLAGNLASQEKNQVSLIASDLIEVIPSILKNLSISRKGKKTQRK